MTKLSLAKLFATTLLASSSLMAHAQIAPLTPPPPPIPGGPGQGLYEGVVELNQITREGGGQWYRVSLVRPMTLGRVQISVLSASVKIHEASIVTENRNRVNLSLLRNTAVIGEGQTVSSEGLFTVQAERAILIDIRAESFGAYADILVHAISPEGTPELTLGELPPSRPQPPPVRPQPPAPRPQPQPPVYPQPPVRPGQPPQQYGDLFGYCQDMDHQQFYKAKQFAYSTQGMDLMEDGAVNWALNYNNTHACGTIQEYIARFNPLRQVAYSTQGLDMTSQEAARFAENMADYVTREYALQLSQTIQAVRSFAYSTQGLDMTSQDAGLLARRWAENRCEDASVVRQIQAQFTKEYNFAYSTSGLNLTSQEAIRYAANRVAYMTRCGFLLAR